MATKKKTPQAVSTSPPEVKTAAELRRESRLYRIVRAFASGATVTEIAQAENIGRTLASRFVNSPESQQILAQFVQNELDLMLEMFYRSLFVIVEAFDATREYTTKDGSVFHGGPDHYARLAAAKQVRDFITAGRPTPKPTEPKERGITVDDLEAIIAHHARRAEEAQKAEEAEKAAREAA
jgi:hypothetical protein